MSRAHQSTLLNRRIHYAIWPLWKPQKRHRTPPTLQVPGVAEARKRVCGVSAAGCTGRQWPWSPRRAGCSDSRCSSCPPLVAEELKPLSKEIRQLPLKRCPVPFLQSGSVHFDTASPVFLEANGRCALTNHNETKPAGFSRDSGLTPWVDSAAQPTAEKSESTSGEINYLALERCPVPFFSR